MSTQTLGSATYSPEDNKLRFYPDARLSKEDYNRARAHGFKWAPKQELFVAPMWTPDREDLMLEWCGEIGDEDKSLIERTEERAERFEDYSDKRKTDADNAHKAVESICEHIPLGQPILVGHHSERRARKDAERIENGMRKAVRAWEQSKYWQDRAASAISHAKYKERPDVRGRRIKGIEADKRRHERNKAEAVVGLKFWTEGPKLRNTKTGEVRQLEMTEANKAKICEIVGASGHSDLIVAKKEGESYGGWSAWDVLQPDGERYKACPACTVAQCQEAAKRHYPAMIAHYQRWINHYENRLAYERAMLEADGGLAGEKFNFEVGGRVNVIRYGWSLIVRVNKRGGEVNSLTIAGVGWRSIGLEEVKEYQPPAPGDTEKIKAVTKVAPLCNYPGEGFLHQTKQEWESTVPNWSDWPKYEVVKATATAGKHRVRRNREPGKEYYHWKSVFLTDAKRVDPPAPAAPAKLAPFVPPATEPRPVAAKATKPDTEAAKFDALKSTLKSGVQVVSAPQLFPTPPELAEKMVEAAFAQGWGVQICAEMNERCRILEPSAGTGNILREIVKASQDRMAGPCEVVTVEINRTLSEKLSAQFIACCKHVCADFLSLNGELGKFDRILMNPPFENGADIKHIEHARKLLNPGGKLVAICANGPRQKEKLEPLCSEWIDLPAGTFKDQGTNVNTALITIEA